MVAAINTPPQRFIAAKQRGHGLRGHIPLEKGGKQHAEQKVQPGRLYVSPKIFEVAKQEIRVCIAAPWLVKA